MTTLWVWIGSPDDKLDVMRYVKPTEKDVLSHPFAAARISQLEAQLADEKSACWSQTAKLEAQLREREAECERLRSDNCDGCPTLMGMQTAIDDRGSLRLKLKSAEQALAATRERIKLFENLLTTMPSYGELVDAAGLTIISQDALAALKSRSEGSAERVMPESFVDDVREAMAISWYEYVNDSHSHPSEFEMRGKELWADFERGGNWSRWVAQRIWSKARAVLAAADREGE